MSVALRSCASRTLFSFSGCEERDGGERSSVLCPLPAFGRVVVLGLKSEVKSSVVEGAIAEVGSSLDGVCCEESAQIR